MRRLYRGYWACVGKACGAVFSVDGGWFEALFAKMQLIVAQFLFDYFSEGFVNRNDVVVFLHRD